MSVRKHRREGGAKKALSEDDKKSHPGPFSFDETRELEEARNNTTDEEAGKPGKRSRRQKLLERKQKKSKKEDARAIRHMRRGGTSEWEKSVGRKHGAITRNGVLTNEEPRRGRSKERRGKGKGERPKTHSKLSMSGFERKQMALSLGDLGGPVLGGESLEMVTDSRDRERRRERSEMEPAQVAPYPRGGEML